MARLTLASTIESIPRVGPTLARRFSRLGIQTVRDLLLHFPFRYDDFSKLVPISSLTPGATATIRGRITLIKNRRSPRKRLMLTEALVADPSGTIKVIWFNQPFLTKTLQQGNDVFLSGRVERTTYGVEFVAPTYEKVKVRTLHTARLVPVYSTTEDLTNRQLRFLIESVLPLRAGLPDPLPVDLRKRERLIDLPTAVADIHFPPSPERLNLSRNRFAFEELFLLQLRVLRHRALLEKERGWPIPFDESLVKSFVASLPFKLTNAQRKAAWQIFLDLKRARPMNRLLEGDVGSGKTVVATVAALNAAKQGFQTAFMAPTALLAKQHATTIVRLLKPFHVSVALLTSKRAEMDGTPEKRTKVLKRIEDGRVSVVIGTHALLERDIRFQRLAFVVVDEQHRFGVEQRFRLRRKRLLTADKLTNNKGGQSSEVRSQQSVVPHLLSMTATPIPRTLALTAYADLDLSVLNELPPGRRPITTSIVPPDGRERAYAHVLEEAKRGRQTFVICPLIDPNDALGVKSATAEYDRLKREVFSDLRLGLVHGRLAAAKRDKTMEAFRSGKLDVLVATAVIEVGIDVPKATVMIIEGAERFGLAQLHQFRGRIGRSDLPSTCFLFTDATAGPARPPAPDGAAEDGRAFERLNAVVESTDGFALAEKDLAMRGPGEALGLRQSGFPELRFARLTDHALISRTQEDARAILAADPTLKRFPELRDRTEASRIDHPE